MGLRAIETRAKMPLVSGDEASGSYVYQEMRDAGFMTVMQAEVRDFDPELLQAFGFSIEAMMPRVQNNMQLSLVKEEGRFATHHQRIVMPRFAPVSNRSMFMTTYHSFCPEGEYTLVRSSQGND